MPIATGAISQASIARMLNLSQRTVSLCLAGSDRVADDTRQRVLAAANDLGYRPNRSALAMRSGRFNAIALLQSTHPDYSFLPEDRLISIQEELMRRKMHLVLASVPDEKLVDAEFLPSVLREWSVDGFLVNYNYGFSQRIVDVIDANRLPSIWLNTKRPYDCVYPDEIGGGRMLTEHLLKLGHKRIAFFSHRRFEDHFSVGDRYNGYEQAMRAAGRTARKMFFSDSDGTDSQNGFRYIHSILDSPDRPTAIVAYESFEAMRVVFTAVKMGLDVPGDLSLATFHERSMDHSGFPLTLLRIPEMDLGRVAMEQLLRRIEKGESQLPPRAVPFTTLSGNSASPPRA